MIPRAIIISSTSRKLSGNRWYNQTQWLMISTGYRNPLYDGTTAATNPAPPHRDQPTDHPSPPSSPTKLTVPIEWSTRTARLLPRYLKGRTRGPLFLTERSAGGSRRPATVDLDPHTGRARLGYDGARDLARTWLGFDLHQFRHSAATHLGEQGIALQLIMLKTRHKSEKAARIYVQPSLDALTDVTEQLNRSRRRS